MRRIVTSLLLSLFILSGTGVAFADRHHDRDHDRKEYRHNDRRHDNGHRKENKKEKHGKKWNAPKPTPRHNAMPTPPREHTARHTPPPPPRHDFHANLGPMVRHAGRGARDIDVWQINADTYVMRYRVGRHFYTRYLYPGSGRYGRPSLISVNWSPMTPWIPVPTISLNINI